MLFKKNHNAALIECGKECLNRLTGMVIGDLEATVSEIFTQEWLSPDGSQMKIIIATTSDYIQDFQTLLSNFWFEKLRITMGRNFDSIDILHVCVSQ